MSKSRRYPILPVQHESVALCSIILVKMKQESRHKKKIIQYKISILNVKLVKIERIKEQKDMKKARIREKRKEEERDRCKKINLPKPQKVTSPFSLSQV